MPLKHVWALLKQQLGRPALFLHNGMCDVLSWAAYARRVRCSLCHAEGAAVSYMTCSCVAFHAAAQAVHSSCVSITCHWLQVHACSCFCSHSLPSCGKVGAWGPQ